MPKIRIKPDDKPLNDYYKNLKDLRQGQKVQHEGGIRRAFGALLSDIAKKQKWTLVEEVSIKSSNSNRWIRPDGALRDQWQLPHAWWEAKDTQDDLDFEIEKKRASGYPFENTIFENTQTAILYQNGYEILRCPVQNRQCFAQLLTEYLNYEIKPFEEFEQAIEAYKEKIPNIAKALKQKIESAHQDNKAFQAKFDVFMNLCRQSLNPNISREAVDEMLIQHLMTERVIRRVFNVERFTRVNVIAKKIEEVIDALTSAHFNRQEFLGGLDRFYRAIESAADHLADFGAKQHFINTVYERFFQGYSVKVADTHGIVYTPQPIVDFMCAAVEEALANEFGAKLGDEDVILIDPATGTGNFVVNLLRRAFEGNQREFERFYKERLFANEVMLMPYYIASLNIEHQYFELTGKTDAFPGLCFVDTLDLARSRQMTFFTEANAARVERQKAAAINVIIGNPPYNMGQINENDNNKNRKYDVIEKRIRDTYAKDSRATLKNKLYDAYVKFFRWAVDRLGERDGIVCYVSNNSFVDAHAFDGFRKHFLQDFNRVYHLDLGGNIRKNQSGASIGNVFDIRVGVGITIAIRNKDHQGHRLYYHAVPDTWSKEKKLDFLSDYALPEFSVPWETLQPNREHTWLVSKTEAEFESYLPIGSKEAKRAKLDKVETIFKTYCPGANTARDAWVYNYEYDPLVKRMRQFVEDYNTEVDRYKRQTTPKPKIDDFVDYKKIKWSYALKQKLKRGKYAEHSLDKIRNSLYRPFTKKLLYYVEPFIDGPGLFKSYLPNTKSEVENRIIICSDVAYRANSVSVIISDLIPDLHLCASTDSHQCFPFYTYDQEGDSRRENITDWALARFQAHYQDETIGKWDIFDYVYALLHHPRYRERYAADLKRQLPRIPYAPDFRAFAQAGKELAHLHLNDESVQRYELEWQVTKTPVSYRVDKMLPKNKRKSEAGYSLYDSLEYNDSLTLRGIPERAFAYRLGNRSALDWIVNQYRVKTDRRSDITSDPNGYSDDEQYILKLIERVIWISLRTVKIVGRLETLPFRDSDPSP